MVFRRLPISMVLLFLSLGFISPQLFSADASGSTRTVVGQWIDNTHDFLGESFNRPIAWFDRFFLTKEGEYETNHSYFRLIGNYGWVNGEGFQFKPQFRTKIRLKAFERRLSIIAFGDDTGTTLPPSANPLDPDVVPASDATAQKTRIGFRYTFMDWVHARFDADLLFRSTLVPEPSLRYRLNLYSTDRSQARVTVKGFWDNDVHFGQRTRLEYGYRIAPRWTLDIAGTGRQSQQTPSVQWDGSINTGFQLSRKAALVHHVGASGPTRPHTYVQHYRTSLLYRQQFYRTWMFFDVEPGIDWPYENNHRHPVLSTVFRLELQFKV